MSEEESILTRLQAELGPLEKLRRESARTSRQGSAIVLATLVAGIIGCWVLYTYVGLIAAVAVGIIMAATLGLIYYYMVSQPLQEYRQKFKREFIHRLLESLVDEVRYVPEGDRWALTEYRLSELFTTAPDREKIEDTIFAKIGGIDLVISEMHTQYETKLPENPAAPQPQGNMNEMKQSQWHTIFKGLFISADFHKKLQGKTFVRPNTAEKVFGKIGRFFQSMQSSNLERVQPEDSQFARDFMVWSSNPMEALSLLSPSLMQRILEISQTFAGNVQLSFQDSKAFVAISTNRDFFEPDVKKSLTELATLQESLEQVQMILGFAKDLDRIPER